VGWLGAVEPGEVPARGGLVELLRSVFPVRENPEFAVDVPAEVCNLAVVALGASPVLAADGPARKFLVALANEPGQGQAFEVVDCFQSVHVILLGQRKAPFGMKGAFLSSNFCF